MVQTKTGEKLAVCKTTEKQEIIAEVRKILTLEFKQELDAIRDLMELRDFKAVCMDKHAMNDSYKAEQEIHRLHIEETAKQTNEIVKGLAESQILFSKFIERHSPNFEKLANTFTTLGGLKSALGWTAAIMSSLSIIIGGIVATWLVTSNIVTITLN